MAKAVITFSLNSLLYNNTLGRVILLKYSIKAMEEQKSYSIFRWIWDLKWAETKTAGKQKRQQQINQEEKRWRLYTHASQSAVFKDFPSEPSGDAINSWQRMQINPNMGWDEIKEPFIINDKITHRKHTHTHTLAIMHALTHKTVADLWLWVRVKQGQGIRSWCRNTAGISQDLAAQWTMTLRACVCVRERTDRCLGWCEWQARPEVACVLAGWRVQACVCAMPAGEESAAPYGAVKINIKSKNALAVGGLALPLSLSYWLTPSLFLLHASLSLSLSISFHMNSEMQETGKRESKKD